MTGRNIGGISGFDEAVEEVKEYMESGGDDRVSAVGAGTTGPGGRKDQMEMITIKFAKKLATGEKDGTLSPEEFEQLTVGALRRAVVEGDVESGSFLCGAISGMVNEIKTCADIVKEINDGAEKLLKI